jgi:hypothetical protein
MRAVDGEEFALEGHTLSGQQQPDQAQRLLQHRGSPPGGDLEQPPLGRAGGPQAEHRQHPPGRQPGQRRQVLGHQHRMTPGQHRNTSADLQPRGARQRVRHTGERLDKGTKHHL